MYLSLYESNSCFCPVSDVANSIGPYMAIFAIGQSGSVLKSQDTSDNGLWICALGGIAIGTGLCLFGYQIIEAIGVKLLKITPPRGASIELGASIVIIFGSYLGLPLSTTHCVVGAMTGVGFFEGKKGLNPWILMKTVIGWVITLIVVGISTGLLFAWGLNAPLTDGKTSLLLDEQAAGWATGHGYVLNSTA